MAKACKRNTNAIRRLFIDNPGWVDCEPGGHGEHVYRWNGGEIAAVRDECVGPMIWLDNLDCLPWRLDWIQHDLEHGRWYIRRRPDKKESSDD